MKNLRGYAMTFDQSFTSIAPYYDQLMQDINYELWVDYIEELFELFNVSPKRILDVGCGTGNPTLILASRGYEVVGVDSSKEMLEVAREKSRNMPNVRFYHGDARNFTLDDEEPFDAAISLFDSLNNITTEGELLSAFSAVFEHLKHKAPFLFDLNTIYALENYWSDKIRVREQGELVSIWRTRFFHRKRISELHITLFVPVDKKTYRRIDEIHIERGYKISTIKRLLRKAGFSEVYAFQHLTRLPASEQNMRVMFVAR